MKELYCIKELYDVDGGFGDAVQTERTVGYVMATPEEIEEYKKKWHHPRCYDVPFCELWDHIISVEKVKMSDINTLVPYDGDPNAPHCSRFSGGSYPYDEE